MIKTGYSFHVAIGHMRDVVERLAEIGWQDAPISDRNGTFGFVEWTKHCTEAGLRPVYGVELPVTTGYNLEKPGVDHWTFLAKDDITALHDIIGRATKDDKPMLSAFEALRMSPGVIKIAHEYCMPDVVDWSAPDFYLGLTPATPCGLANAAIIRGAKLVAMPRNVYPRAADRELYRVMLGRFRASPQSYPQHIVSDMELLHAQPLLWDLDFDDAIERCKDVLSQCRATLRTAELFKFKSERALIQMCHDGGKRLHLDLAHEPYASRLARELRLIREKQFEDYFFIIADLMAWARQHMVVGPARGSSCGSLVCYLLGITAIDPIPHDLMFERFIDISRSDLPDIDLDFDDQHRDEVIGYAERKYGNRVARLANVAIFQPRSALNKVGSNLRIPTWMVNNATALDSDTIALALATVPGRKIVDEYPEVKIVERFEDHPDHASVHAAGIVVTDKPVSEYVAINRSNGTAMCNKYDAETLNLLKIDTLGLKQLSVFARTLEQIGVEPRSNWLEALPVDDAAAFAVLNSGRYAGIFQFTGAAMAPMARRITFRSIADIAAATALVRPGPLQSGGTERWIRCKAGQERVAYADQLLEPVLSETAGVMVYQEQIMRIAREIGGLDWADVTSLRKAMAKTMGKEHFAQWGEPWMAGAVAKGMPQSVAREIWAEMCDFGAYAFNKSHSVAYAYLSYWCAYLKAHHPMPFMAATLDAATTDKQVEILRELADDGITYVAVDRDRSTDRWQVDGRKLIGPLSNIRGIGDAGVTKIISARNGGGPLKEESALAKLLADAKTDIDSLYPVADRLRQLWPNGLREANIETAPTRIADLKPGGPYLVICVLNSASIRDENDPARVRKRKGRLLTGQTNSLSMWLQDDSGKIFAKVDRSRFDDLGTKILDNGGIGNLIYAVKGIVPVNFNMLDVSRFCLLGTMDGSPLAENAHGRRVAQVIPPSPAAGALVTAGVWPD